MEPTFAIIMTTYRRPELVLRSIDSVRAQTYKHWHYYIVVDDTTSDYQALHTRAADDKRVRVMINEQNRGKNASVNRVLDALAEQNFTGHIVFLDDDDWLDGHCLEQLAKEIGADQTESWIVANRTQRDNTPFTKNQTGTTKIHYYRDYLLLRRFSGDATHCIAFAKVRQLRFPLNIKNAEEWLYFAQVAKTLSHFTYLDIPGTYSDGYRADGLTKQTDSRRARLHIYRLVVSEAFDRRLFNMYVWLYLLGRLTKLLLR